MPKLDSPEIPVATPSSKQYVTIPDRDIFDMQFPDIQINLVKYEHGQTHYVDASIAETLNQRIKSVERANIRLMQPRKDANAEELVRRGQNEGVQTTAF